MRSCATSRRRAARPSIAFDRLLALAGLPAAWGSWILSRVALEIATWIASWCAALAALIVFPALGLSALAHLRRARVAGAPVERERVVNLAALAVVAFALAVGLQLSFLPFYARGVAGYVVRGEITRVTRVARGSYKGYTADVRYTNKAGRALTLRAGASREQYEACDSRWPRCAEPTSVIVVDGPLGFDQAGSKPTVPGLSVAIGYVMAWLLFGGLRHLSPASPPPSELEELLGRARRRLHHVALILSAFVVVLITAVDVPAPVAQSTLVGLATWVVEGALILGLTAAWARARAKAIARLSWVMGHEVGRIRGVEIRWPVSPVMPRVEVALDTGERLVIGYWSSAPAERLVAIINAARSSAR